MEASKDAVRLSQQSIESVSRDGYNLTSQRPNNYDLISEADFSSFSLYVVTVNNADLDVVRKKEGIWFGHPVKEVLLLSNDRILFPQDKDIACRHN